MDMPRVLICQNRACRKAGSAQVLAAFQAIWPELNQLESNQLESNQPEPNQIIGCHCLGHCGNGPTVLILPEQIWYHQVHPDQVPALVRRHLGNPNLSNLRYPT